MNPSIVPIQPRREAGRLMTATVKGLAEQSIVIDCDDGIVNARKAFSCLVEPQVSDRVSVSADNGEFFVLAILERPGDQSMHIEVPASLRMNAKAGSLGLSSRDNIELTTPADCNWLARRLNLNSVETRLKSRKLFADCEDMTAQAKQAQLFTGLLNTVANQVAQRANSVVRWVEDVETLNLGNLIQKIRRNYTHHSEHAVLTARKDMRMDAERIHMG